MATRRRSAAKRGPRRNFGEDRRARAFLSSAPKNDSQLAAAVSSSCSVDVCGAMGCIDSDGTDHYNFPQTVWLYPHVLMRATTRFTRAAEVLAVNILSLVLTERDYQAFEGRTSARAVYLARYFYEDCLSELPTEGWCIPLETIREWLHRTSARND